MEWGLDSQQSSHIGIKEVIHKMITEGFVK